MEEATVQNKTAPMGLQHVPLKDIEPDPNQPRHLIDEGAMKELITSVKEMDVLQPILLRRNGKKFMIVTGHRRFKAKLEVEKEDKTRNTIPAMIVDIMNDDDALQAQIVENLQREDVHPMEEAVAFKSLIEREKHPLTIEQVASRVGKSVLFVRQRLKLNDLTEDWQHAYFKDLIYLGDALRIARLPHKQQEQFATEHRVKSTLKSKSPEPISLNDYSFKQFTGDLSQASFPLDDATLDPKMGACIGCKFNSRTAQLFVNEKGHICSNTTCYANKTNTYFDIGLKKAIEDPGTILVALDSYEDTGKYQKLVGKENKVYSNREVQIMDAPDKPDFAEFKGDYQFDNLTDEQLKKEFAKQEKEYEQELKQWQKGVEGGRYLKAFVLSAHSYGDYQRGSTCWVKLQTKSSSSKVTKSKEQEGTLSLADIEVELSRLNEREKRNAELDLNKIHMATLAAIEKDKKKILALPHKPDDRAIMIYLLVNHIQGLGYHWPEVLKKTLPGIEKAGYSRECGYNYNYYKKLGKVTDNQLATLLRAAVIELWGNPKIPREVGTDDTALRLIAQYGGVDLKAIEKAQAEVTNKRKARVSQRKEQLKGKKKELQGEPKAEPKKVLAIEKGLGKTGNQTPLKKAAKKVVKRKK